MESHASAASTTEVPSARAGIAVRARRLRWDAGAAVCVTVAGSLAAIAFIGNGGLQLGPSTLVEIAVILAVGLLVAAAIAVTTVDTPIYGGVALAGVAGLAALTALSILWSLHPADSWIETNRTLAYAAAFAGGIAAVRLLPRRWDAVLYGVLLALAIVCLYGLATKVLPGWLAEDEVYARLREPYGYWNAVGVTAAMGIPICLWLGTRDAPRWAKALAYPVLGILIVTMLLSFSRGSILAAAVGVAFWLALVPRRLATLAVLLPAIAGAGVVTAWAFSQSALTDDRVALADREDSGILFGVILILMAAALYVAGLLIERRAASRPLSADTRRTIGKVALGSLAAVPLVVLAGLAFTDRGIGGTVSDRWNELTTSQETPQNDPGRLIEAGNVRTIYWARAIDVWNEHEAAGAGAGAFAQAQRRFRDEPTLGRHAHGYVHQTLADLGLLGLGVSLAALVGWLLATRTTLDLKRRRLTEGWTPERTGLLALALVAVVFGVHSALDWTWFVPAVAITGLFCAGWVAGRGPLPPMDAQAAAQEAEQPPPSRVPFRPTGARGVAALAVIAVAVVSALAVAQPWRADREGDESLALLDKGDIPAARAAVERAADINPLSVEPYFERAAIEDAAGNRRAAARALEDAVRLEPASPEAWRRLGEYYAVNLDEPGRAVPVLQGALYLDPASPLNRSAYLVALRARNAAVAEREAAERAARRRRAARRAARAAAATAPPATPAPQPAPQP